MGEVEYIAKAPKYCPSDWNRRNLQKREICDLNYLSVCTSSLFDRTLASQCKKRDLILAYRKVAGELSRLARVGDGDRHCIFRINEVPCEMVSFYNIRDPSEYLKKFEKLLSKIYEKCGKSALREKLTPQVEKLNSLVDYDCPDRGLQNITETADTSETTESMCSLSTFSERTVPIFNSRIFDAKNSETASQKFENVANQLSNGVPECFLQNNKAPCDLLRFPRNEHGCVLSGRLNGILGYLTPRCHSDWIKRLKFSTNQIIAASQPISGVCETGALASRRVREWNRQKTVRFGTSLAEKMRRFRNRHTRRKFMSHDVQMVFERPTEVPEIEEISENLEIPKESKTCFVSDLHGSGEIATHRFEKSLNLALMEAARRRTKLKFNLSNRLSMRFSAVIKFLLDPDLLKKCSRIPVSCHHIAALFGSGPIRSLRDVTTSASALIGQINSQCQKVNFAEFYLTLNGKFDL